MVTFEVSDVALPIEPLLPTTTPAEAIAQLAGRPSGRRGSEQRIEAAASNLPNLVKGFASSGYSDEPDGPLDSTNAFVRAVHAAFAAHLPLTLSPDDIWLCIAQGFGLHVNENAERLRSKFVRHEGRAKVEVIRDDFVRGADTNDWHGVFAEFSDKIAEHIGKQRDLVVAAFSTTGPIERAASEIVLMSAMQQYFKYELTTLCGIPRITLLGSVDDWRSIRTRAAMLAEYDLGFWVDALLPVLDQFVAASSGKVDRAFWQSFYGWNDGSGGPFISGWINVLFPYLMQLDANESGPSVARPRRDLVDWLSDHEAGYGATSKQFPNGLSMAPFVWKYFGVEIPMEFLGGFTGVSQDPETMAVRPAIGWAVRESLDAPARVAAVPGQVGTIVEFDPVDALGWIELDEGGRIRFGATSLKGFSSAASVGMRVKVVGTKPGLRGVLKAVEVVPG